MNIKTFVDRPILSIGISIFIVLFGLISVLLLPIELYPNIAPPAVKVSTSYPGASADAIQKSVIAPLEEAINGVENMMYMTSSASNNGQVSINIYFNQGTDPDMAAVNVQNRVSIGSGTLPAEVTRIGVTTQKEQPSTLRSFAVVSPNGTYDEIFIANYMSINIKPEIQRIQGVASQVIFGGDYSMRIWLKPDVMAQYKLIPSDISAVLAEQNIEMATGSFGETSGQVFQYTMKYSGRKQSIDEFNNLVIRTLEDGEMLRLQDVSTIELGKDSYNFSGRVNGVPGVPSMIYQTSGSNATVINLNIDELFTEIEAGMPEDLEIITMQNSNDFLFASINAVIISLILAILLVFIVVYVFLQDFRATLIPTICIIISLIGTFAFLKVAGFSLNLLTLFALVLVIGTVVDNAIVVVEAVQARFDSGYKSAYKATIDAMGGLISALFTTTLVFMAVFIPVSFMGGTTGVFYTQFGLTMAVAVGISFINSITLSPALCAIMLKPNPEPGQGSKIAEKVRNTYNTTYNAMLKRYTKGAMFFIRRKWLAWFSIAVCVVLLGYFMANTKQGFVPTEDTGVFYVDVSTSPGNTLDQTTIILNEVYQAIKDIPQLDNVAQVSGFGILSGSSVNSGMFIVSLKHWDERKGDENSVNAVIQDLYAKTAHIKAARIFATPPGMIPGYGEGGGFEFQTQDLQGGDIKVLHSTTQQFLAKLNERPEIGMAYNSYNVDYPQFVVDVDAAKCKRAGVSPAEVLSVLGGYYGGSYSSNFNRFSKVYKIMIQADPDMRKNKESLNNIFVRVNGEMAPISQFITLTKVYDPVELKRFNMYSSINVNGSIAPGYSSQDAITAIKEVAAQELPRGYGIDFGGMTREEEEGGNNTAMIFGICILFIFVLMSMLYESYFIPLAVILSIPFGLLGSFLFANIMGMENNIYLQVGLIMLIGLLAKTAILLTEYASQCRSAGMSIKESAFFSAKVRMRPILMTALTMIFGMLPLMFATGVGANGNSTIGAGAVGGMIIGTLALLFIVPVLFVIFQTLQEKVKPIQFVEPTDPMIIDELKIIKEYKAKRTLDNNNKK